jgi:hypothetical protein
MISPSKLQKYKTLWKEHQQGDRVLTEDQQYALGAVLLDDKEWLMENQENEIVTALEIAKGRQVIKIGSKESHLAKVGTKVVSKHSGNSVPALLEWLKQPKRVKLAENYDPTSAEKKYRALPNMKQITAMLTGGAYADNVKEVRGWVPYAFRESLKKGAFLVTQPAGYGPDENGQNHHGETIGMILCPDHPSPALMKLISDNIAKREKRGDMSKAQATAMRNFVGLPPLLPE